MGAARWRLLAALAAAASPCLGQVHANAASAGGNFASGLFEAARPLAEESLKGRFISEMVAGTLPKAAFDYYLRQDNLYLTKYARAFAVLGAKSDNTDELVWLLNASVGFLHEHGPGHNRHVDDQTFEREASATTLAYTSFFLQATWGEEAIIGYASVLPCQHLYDWLFATINATRDIAPDNPYKEFIRQYADPGVHRTTLELEAFLDRYAQHGLSEEVAARAQYHYDSAMKYEAQFFEEALHHSGGGGGGDGGGGGGTRSGAIAASGTRALALVGIAESGAAVGANAAPAATLPVATVFAHVVRLFVGGFLPAAGVVGSMYFVFLMSRQALPHLCPCFQPRREGRSLDSTPFVTQA